MRRHRRRWLVADLAEIGVFGGSGFYTLLEDVREAKVDTPYGPPSDSVFLATIAGRRVAFLPAPRPSPHHPAAPDQLPGERLGDALAGREGGHQPLRRGVAPAGRRARALRRQRPVRRPHDRPRGHVLRRPDRVPRLVGRDLRPDPARDRPRRHPRARHHRPRRRDRRGDPGPALLDQGRVEVVQRRRLAGHQHDPVPRGLPVPRARDGGRQHRPDHRLRRRACSRAPRP